LSGGISSSIAGGSFWKGVREGIITSGLNHVASNFVKDKVYSAKDKKKTISNDGTVKNKGNSTIINLFDENKDGPLWYVADSDNDFQDGRVKLYSHASKTSINGMKTVAQLTQYLSEVSLPFKDFITNGGELTLEVKACKFGQEGGLADQMVKAHKGLTIIAPTTRYQAFGTKYFGIQVWLENFGYWRKIE